MEEYNPKKRVGIYKALTILQICFLVMFFIGILTIEKPEEQKQKSNNQIQKDIYEPHAKKPVQHNLPVMPNSDNPALYQAPKTERTIKPSFDCAKASTPSEKAICSNANLAELDNRLAKAYKNARSACQKDVKQEQREWLKEVNSCSSNIQCLKNSYISRIQELENCW